MPAFPDWSSILPDTGAPLAPGDDPDFIWSQPTRLRGCFVRLDDVVPALAKRELAQSAVAVYADVLRIDGALSLAVAGLTLHARRIEVGAKASLAVSAPDSSQPACRLEIHADEWVFGGAALRLPLRIGEIAHELLPGLAGGGVEASVAADGSVALRELDAAAAGDALTGQIELDVARRLVHSPQLDAAWSLALPLKIADWVARTGAEALLRSDARAFAAHLRTPRRSTHFVPYLQLDEYADLAAVTQDALQAVEQEYRNLFNRALSLDDQKQAASQMLKHYQTAKTYADRLLQQAANDCARASDAATQARATLEQRGNEIEEKQRAFEEGIAAKKAELEREAVFNIVTGVLALAGGIAMVCFTGPAGVTAAAGGAAQVAGAGAKTAQQVNRLVELLKTIAKVLDAIKKIQGYYLLLKGAFESIRDPLQARDRAQAAAERLPEPLDPGDTMSAADWDEFLAALEGAFKPALDQGIAGADELLLAMKKLAIRGKDLVATQANLDRAQQRLQQCLWQTLRDESDIADMKERIDGLTAARGPGTVLMTYYGQLRDRLKFRLIHAIENMSDAYRYYALAEPDVRPGIASSGADLAKMLSDIRQALVTAKERRGTISDWGPDGPSEQAPAQLAALQATGSMSWSVGTENFVGLDRIRVRDIRVWLRGDLGPQRFHITIGTSGDYLDRLGRERFEFAAWPLQRTFRYERVDKGLERDAWDQPVQVTLHANDAEGQFFEPTAFTTWTISLPRDYNPGIDTSRISGVSLEFIGTAMGARMRSRVLAAAPAKLVRKVVAL